jgi:hypothetical protein
MAVVCCNDQEHRIERWLDEPTRSDAEIETMEAKDPRIRVLMDVDRRSIEMHQERRGTAQNRRDFVWESDCGATTSCNPDFTTMTLHCCLSSNEHIL